MPDTVEKLDLCPFCGLTGYFLGHVYIVKSSMFIAGSSGRKGSKWGLLHGTGVFQQHRAGAKSCTPGTVGACYIVRSIIVPGPITLVPPRNVSAKENSAETSG
jgi:hypothetical protein